MSTSLAGNLIVIPLTGETLVRLGLGSSGTEPNTQPTSASLVLGAASLAALNGIVTAPKGSLAPCDNGELVNNTDGGTTWAAVGSGGGGGTVWTSFTDSTDATFTMALESANIVRRTAAGGNLNVSLPAIGSGDLNKRVQIAFKIIGAAQPGDQVTILPTGGGVTIDGASSIRISLVGACVFYVQSATSWRLESGVAS